MAVSLFLNLLVLANASAALPRAVDNCNESNVLCRRFHLRTEGLDGGDPKLGRMEYLILLLTTVATPPNPTLPKAGAIKRDNFMVRPPEAVSRFEMGLEDKTHVDVCSLTKSANSMYFASKRSRWRFLAA